MDGDVGNVLHFQLLADAQCPAGELVQPLLARQIHAAGKLRQGGGRKVVCLIQHQQAVVQLRQKPRPQGREQQIVVHHDHLGGHQLLASLEVAATGKGWAVPPGAGAAFGGNGGPYLRFGRGGQAVAVTVPGTARQSIGHAGIEPEAHLLLCCRRGGWGQIAQQIVHAVLRIAAGETLQLELADKASASLGQGIAKGRGQILGQCRQILVDQLLLQGHGGRGNQHPCAALQCQGNGWGTVGQGFAHTGTCLDDGHPGIRRCLPLFGLAQFGGSQRFGNQGCHGALAVAGTQAGGGGNGRIEGRKGQLGPFFGVHADRKTVWPGDGTGNL